MNEKEARELWADRYEKEQKEHSDSSTELLLLKSKYKDLELDYGNLYIKHENLLQTHEKLSDNYSKKEDELNTCLIDLENSRRENQTWKESFK